MNKPTLRQIRESCGKKVSEVANALGVTNMAIYRYENGKRAPSLEQVLTLSELYDVDVKEIIEASVNSQHVQEDNRRTR